MQNLSHQTQNSIGCVGKIEGHHRPLIEALINLKCRLPLISWSDPYLMATAFQINLSENLCSSLIKEVGNFRNGKLVFFGNFIYGKTIHAHSSCSVFLEARTERLKDISKA